MNKLPQFTAIASLQIGSKHSFGVTAYNLDNAIYPAQVFTKARNYESPAGGAVPRTCMPPCHLLSHDDVNVLKEACDQSCKKCWDGMYSGEDHSSCNYAFSAWCDKNSRCPFPNFFSGLGSTISWE